MQLFLGSSELGALPSFLGRDPRGAHMVFVPTRRGLPYVGMSAGAVIAGPDLQPLSELSDPSLAPQLPTTAALGLVEFVIIPHYNWPERAAVVPRLVAEYGDRFRLLPLTDGQALVVDEDGPRIVRSA
jgi:dipeptidase E